MKRIPHFFLALTVVLTLTACASTGDADAKLTMRGDLSIDLSTLSNGVTFVPSPLGGKAQLLVAKTNDTVAVKLDTCNSCNGSPLAYYAFDGAHTITCQNCGFTFDISELDERQGGCSPMDIPSRIEGDEALVALADLQAVEPLFARIDRQS